MNYSEVLEKAREVMAPKCRVCKVCDGRACRGEIPGTGGFGNGEGFTSCVEYLKNVKLCMDAVHADFEPDTSVSLFGETFRAPVFIAPIGGMGFNYNGYLTETEYTKATVFGALSAGILAFTGDGPSANYFPDAMAVVREAGGKAVPTVKPWERDKVFSRIEEIKKAGCTAWAMDIDSAALVNLKLQGCTAYTKTEDELREFVRASEGIPFLVKGVMTARAAERCRDAGAYGAVVSTHGGRILQDTLPPVSMIREIRERVGKDFRLLVDGGVRSGADVLKCLALGADAVLIGRPYAVAAHGGLAEGVTLYTEKVRTELSESMRMTDCRALADIAADRIRNLNTY